MRLDTVGKNAFLKVLYTVMLQDKVLSDEEEKTLELISKEIFKLEDYEQTNLKTSEKTATEINKIKSETAIVFLAEILVYIAKNSTEKKSIVEFLHQVFLGVEMPEDIKTRLFDMIKQQLIFMGSRLAPPV